MADQIRFQCSCGTKLKANPERCGEKISCPSCGEPIRVPEMRPPIDDPFPPPLPKQKILPEEANLSRLRARSIRSEILSVVACCVAVIAIWLPRFGRPDPKRQDEPQSQRLAIQSYAQHDQLVVGKLSAKSIEITDANGAQRIVLNAGVENRPVIVLTGDDEKARLSIMTDNETGQISFFRGENFALTIGRDGDVSSLKVYDKGGKPRILCGVTEGEKLATALIGILDANGKPVQALQ